MGCGLPWWLLRYLFLSYKLLSGFTGEDRKVFFGGLSCRKLYLLEDFVSKSNCPNNPSEDFYEHPGPGCKISGKMIEPLKLVGNEHISNLIDGVFANSGFNARRLAEACKLFSRMIDEDTTIALTLAGAMTPIGMSGPIISLIENGFVDFIVSTGANLYHDMHRPFNYPMFQGQFIVDDNELAEQDIARIYDVYIEDKDTLQATDTIVHRAAKDLPSNEPISTARLHRALGECIAKQAPKANKSLLAKAAEYDVPIYVSAPGDSSIAMNLVVENIFNKPIILDPVRDIIETTAIVRDAETNGAVEVGGGSPKNFYLQTQPTLQQILRDNSKGGHDYFIQLTTDSPHWGGLSGATPQEARSWGKIKDANINNVVVYSCASITFPILCQYVLAANKPRKHRRLYGRLAELERQLVQAAKANPELLSDMDKIKQHVNGQGQ